MTLIAAADGSALGNPGAAGWAWYIDENRWRAGGWAHATNNQAELMAVLSLLQETSGDDSPLHILCDSKYVINALTQWLPGWKRRGWRKADGKAVLNRDLLEPLDEHLKGRAVTFEWVKGHSGHVLNDKVDELAKRAATAFQRGGHPDEGPGFSRRSQTDAVDARPVVQTSPALFEFSDDEPVSDSRVPSETRQEILRAEELLRSRRDATLVSRLLRPGSIVVTASGEFFEAPWDGQLPQDGGDASDVEVLRFEQLATGTVLGVFRTARGSICSSVWQRDDQAQWHRVMHQESASARS